MANLTLLPGNADHPPRLCLEGDLSIFEVRDTHTALLVLLNEHPGPWDLDLSALGELDSAGLQLLLALARRFGGDAPALRIVALSEETAALLALLRPTGLLIDPQLACAG